ncbi:AMP-binding protein [Rhodococcus fascians]|nr:AMP-binding protein [Rhodococcus fascians]MBY4238360.1 AMP-binding protein [Rhodococcus fascians]MBY4254259.1 AMP-binding protein [Rhodococcus fascians]MBY4269640.1 AMP-binding protein [Rhodococcus fascians]
MRGNLLPGVDIDRLSPVADLIVAESTRPDNDLLVWANGRWTVTQFATTARQCAAVLREKGIRPGDHVALVGLNSHWRLAWQYGIYWLGAVEVSVNSELKGPMLAHVLSDSAPVLIMVDDALRELVEEQDCSAPLEQLDTGPSSVCTAAEQNAMDRDALELPRSGLSTILYTSGTTGPSKGVMLPRAYFSKLAAVMGGVLALEPGDTGYFVLPFFHVDAHIVLPACIQSGSSLSFNTRFSVRRFWSEIEQFEATWVFVIGSVLSAVATAPAPAPGTSTVTRFLGAPIPDDAYTFYEDGLGIPILSMFGQTEGDGPAFETMENRRRGSAGYACAGFDLAVLDESGNEVAAGMNGEIVYRPQYPDMVALGYLNRPQATVAAWAGLWFHTGDRGYLDNDGFLFYTGRFTDSLRRRGENISAYELESVVRSAPRVLDCAALGVVDELGGEDEIKVLVSCAEGEKLDIEEFFAYCEEALPRYALPRYVEQVTSSEFVRSVGTGVIQKHRLSKETSGDGIVDRATLDRATK